MSFRMIIRSSQWHVILISNCECELSLEAFDTACLLLKCNKRELTTGGRNTEEQPELYHYAEVKCLVLQKGKADQWLPLF